jgi:FtsP/CotA-like multicopper oxidase with cupredoxin domain
MTPGERIDVLVKPIDKPGSYRLLSLPYDRRANRLERITLMTVLSEGSGVNDALPESINPGAVRLDMDLAKLKKRKIYLIMANGRGLVNMKDFDVEPYVITSRVGTYEVWEILNISPMDHPFHQHTNECQILEIKGGDPGYASLYSRAPAWKDTFNIPFGGSATVLVPIKDFTGTALFHCHILQHEDIGMMGIWKMV